MGTSGRRSGPAEDDGRTPASSAASRWSAGKDLTFVPLRAERVVEVRYDHLEGERFRHTTQFVRWRTDRDPRSCTFSQLEEPISFALSAMLQGPWRWRISLSAA